MKYMTFLSIGVFFIGMAIFHVPSGLQMQQENDNKSTSVQIVNKNEESKSDKKDFREVDFLDENYGWAANQHSLFVTTDGGKNWTEIRKAGTREVGIRSHEEVQNFIERIQILDKNEGWILEDSVLLHSIDAGKSWEKYEKEFIDIRSFRFVSQEHGWLIGQHYYYGDNQPFKRVGEIYETKDKGLTWTKVSINVDLNFVWLLDIYTASTNNIWVVGDKVLHSQNAGETWEEVEVPFGNGFYGRPSRIKFIDSNTGWITADGYLVTTDGGQTWTPRRHDEFNPEQITKSPIS